MFSLFFTNVAYAAEGRTLDSFLNNVDKYIVNPIIIFLFALALAYFLWGMVDFLSNSENEEKRTAGKKHMIFGILGITIMMAVWTILRILLNTLNIPESEINPETGKVDLHEYTPTNINNLPQ